MVHIYPYASSDLRDFADTAFALVECKYNGRNPAAKLVTSELLRQYRDLEAVWNQLPPELVEHFSRSYERYEAVAVKNLKSFESREELAVEVCVYAMAILGLARAMAVARADAEKSAMTSGVKSLPTSPPAASSPATSRGKLSR